MQSSPFLTTNLTAFLKSANKLLTFLVLSILRGTLVICDQECPHASSSKHNCKHWTEGHGGLHVLHGVNQQLPLEASKLINRDTDPDHGVDEEELEIKVDHALHRHGTRRSVLIAFGVLNGEDR